MLQERHEAVQPLVPEFTLIAQPRLGSGQLLRLEPYEMIPAGDAAPNESRSLQHGNVLRHRVQREAVPSGELRHASLRRVSKLLQEPAARSMTEREEELVESLI